MTAIQPVLERAVAAGDLPYVMAMAARSDRILFQGACGAEADTVFRIYSMTKAIGALAAMLLIDRGQLSLDTPVAELLPEWDDLQVLEGFDGDVPRLRRPRTVATIRHLATHTSGLEYDHWCAPALRYAQLTGTPLPPSGRMESLRFPLMFDPGTRWGYGMSTDWLGRVVEAVDGRRIDRFCRDEIFAPLGLEDTRFEPDGLAHRLRPVFRRSRDGGLREVAIAPPAQPEFYGMGHALYSTAADYLRFLRLILNRGTLDGTRLLSPAAVTALCADQMRGLTVPPMRSVMPQVSADVELFPGLRITHGLAFPRYEAAVPGRRGAGSLGWAGICNTHYWIDPGRDVAAVLMTQLLPFAEPRMLRVYDAYERAVYAAL